MGSKFANLQVHDLSISQSQKLLPGSTAFQFSKEWTTIVREDFQIGLIEKEARKLSKKIDNVVMSVGYFDDDVLALNIYRNGKNVASHVSGNAYSNTKKSGNPSIFVKELNLPETYRDYLKYIFKCEDLPKKVELLENLIGIPLWIDHRMMEESSVDNFKCNRDIDFIEQYIKEKKRLEKIKNITKATLITEFEGMLDTKSDSGCFLISHPSVNGEYYGDTAKLYTTLPNGLPEKLIKDDSISFKTHSELLYNERLVAVYEQFTDDKSLLSIYNHNGEAVDKLYFPEEAGSPILLLPDGSVIFSSYGDNEVITKFNSNAIKQWELNVGYLHVYPVFFNGYIFLHYEDFENNKAEIIKVNQEGVIEARYELMPRGGCHWENFIFDKSGNLYYCCSIDSGDTYSTKLLCFDNNLKKIADLDFSDTSFKGLIDIDNNRIFTLLFPKEILTVDINTFKINVQRKFIESLNLLCADSRSGLVIVKGSSTIEVFNTNLDIVSKHRLKGDIYCFYENSLGNICIVTGNGTDYDYGKADRSLIRVYEIEYL